MYIDPATAKLLSEEALDVLTSIAWTFQILTRGNGSVCRILVEEPCPACQFIREQLFDRDAYTVPYNSSFIDPDSLALHCINGRPEIPCPASKPGGLPPEVWVRRYIEGNHGDEIDLLAGGR